MTVTVEMPSGVDKLTLQSLANDTVLIEVNDNGTVASIILGANELVQAVSKCMVIE